MLIDKNDGYVDTEDTKNKSSVYTYNGSELF
jgi:hypothetical protein